MPRIPLRDPDEAPKPIGEILSSTPLALLGIVAHAESAFEPWLRYSNSLLRHLQLDPLLRELAILQVAHLSASEYEWVQHVPIAESFGASPAQIAAIEAGDDDHGGVDADQRAVLGLTREVLVDGAGSEASVRDLTARLGDREVVELLLVIGNYMGLARLIATVALEPHEPVVRLPGGTDALGPR
ncbi:MAG TPA: carboxymuconolactone decarboxylase family protein [Solirubrobacteraceae bacterium]|jgi:alkylhydroperoxidase family enzyme|nr:carboxymuconolactone decarboxylase family protein [Solirubrobacteraceae bacterium]